MLDEPTAAALGYGMTEQENLLVIDFGAERWIYLSCG
jgi:molecular chaperone DnaK (HSP70)